MGKIKIFLLLFAFTVSSCGSDDSEDTLKVIITPNVGIGNITFEDDGNNVMAEYGAYENLTAIRSASDTYFVMWYENGLGFQLDHVTTQGLTLQEVIDMSSDLIDLDQKIIQMVMMFPFEAETAEGIGRGSSREEVLAAYGEPDDISGSIETYKTLKIHFHYNTSKEVRRIDLFK